MKFSAPMGGRYDQLYPIINIVTPTSILEVGTWNGVRAILMMTRALQHRDKVSYSGFDLFEGGTPETDTEEMNVKKHFSEGEVHENLMKWAGTLPASKTVNVRLHRGNTRETLKHVCPAAGVDMVFLDGGHSVETIESDYNNVRAAKIIVFDDYYRGAEIDINKFGCNKIVEELPHCLLPAKDPVMGGGHTYFAVTGNPSILAKIAKAFKVDVIRRTGA